MGGRSFSGVSGGSTQAVWGDPTMCVGPFTRVCIHSFIPSFTPSVTTHCHRELISVLEIPSAQSCPTQWHWPLSVENTELVARRRPVGSVLGWPVMLLPSSTAL